MIHDGKYQYGGQEGNKEVIFCSIHGKFLQRRYAHLAGQACPSCGTLSSIEKRRSNKKEFLKRAQALHMGKYEYSNVDYKTRHTKVTIDCVTHGGFSQTPGHHLSGDGCPKCAIEAVRGSGNALWRGCGDLSGKYWSGLMKGAEHRKIPVEITIEEAWQLFLVQKRQCAFSGEQLTMATTYQKGTASLDRIDSTKGYISGNVQWIHKDFNKMKVNLPEDLFLFRCNQLVTYQRSLGNL